MKAAFDHRPRSNRLTGYSLSPPAILFSFSPRFTTCSFPSLPPSSLSLSLSSCRRKHSRTVPTNHFSPKNHDPRIRENSYNSARTPCEQDSELAGLSNPSKCIADSRPPFVLYLSPSVEGIVITDRSYCRGSSRREARPTGFHERRGHRRFTSAPVAMREGRSPASDCRVSPSVVASNLRDPLGCVCCRGVRACAHPRNSPSPQPERVAPLSWPSRVWPRLPLSVRVEPSSPFTVGKGGPVPLPTIFF